jgi:hypothetical protein
MNPNDVKKTSLITKIGLYEWLVMPFGLENATSIFSRTMIIIFFEWLQQFLKVFVDDLNIHSVSWEAHLDHICMVLQHLRNVNLKLNPNKCMFSTKNIKFLGHVVRKARTSPNLDKVKAMVEFLVSKIVTNKEAFMGLIGYYLNYVKGYAKFATSFLVNSNREFHLMEGECYALIWGVMHFQQFLHRNHFTLKTYHKPLE